MQTDPIVIVSAKRTPIGNLLGSLSSLSAYQLSAIVNKAAIEQAKINAKDIDEVILGCVLSAGQGQAPARQAAIHAGIPYATNATTINKMCGSGMKAVMLAHDLILAGSANVVLAGGMESMSNAPYLLKQARQGYRLGDGQLLDHIFIDGLEDAYHQGKLMGHFAEQTASKYQFSRQQQDTFAITSLKRAIAANNKGKFTDEITPVQITTRQTDKLVTHDEGADEKKLPKIARLKPAFSDTGTVTAANSSSISDGACSLILMRESIAKQKNLIPLAKLVAHSTHAHAPEWFTTAPIFAIKNVLQKTAWQKDDVDLYEINEAFAVVTMAAMQELKLSHEKVNIHGGACALGHPIGASGARIITSLIYALKQQGLKRGIASLCIGGGEATAVAVEIV